MTLCEVVAVLHGQREQVGLEVDCRPITGDPSEGFMEVFKYAVKFSDLSLDDNWHAAQLTGRMERQEPLMA